MTFVYRPDFLVKDIVWNDNSKVEFDYYSFTACGCKHLALNDIKDLIKIDRVLGKGYLMYGLKERNHQILRSFYISYSKHFKDIAIFPNESERDIKSFDDFVNSKPMFFWRDNFGRLIQFSSHEFILPLFCEPIIYLYSEKETKHWQES
ncbi:MAG: hypothetical protein N2558_02455 [Patescibacteria group bacterium]|nr:hypothetical protein [Patescibacteria group bacterium]